MLKENGYGVPGSFVRDPGMGMVDGGCLGSIYVNRMPGSTRSTGREGLINAAETRKSRMAFKTIVALQKRRSTG